MEGTGIGLTPARGGVIIAVIAVAGFSYSLQQTMIVPALPSLQRTFSTTTGWTAWLLTIFLLTAAVSMPIFGRLGDQYGKSRMLVVSLVAFLIGCLMATAAWSIWTLIAARAVQGLGGAIFPLGFSIIKDEFPRERVGGAIGLATCAMGAGGAIGLLLAGAVIDHGSWRLLFVFGTIPVAIALVLARAYLPRSRVEGSSRPDLLGSALLSVGLVAILLALTKGGDWGWESLPSISLFLLAVASLGAWVAVELHVSDPMVNMHTFVHRPVLLTNTTALIAGFSMFCLFALVPAFVQAPGYGLNASGTLTGLILLPSGLTTMLGGPAAGMLARRLTAKGPIVLGWLIVAIGAAMLATYHDDVWPIMVAMAIFGFGTALSFATMPRLIAESVQPTETGVAIGVNAVARTVGGVVGGQFGAALLGAYTIRGTSLPSETGFVTAFWVSAAAALVAALVSAFTTSRRSGAVPREVAVPERPMSALAD